jgi:phospholipase D1/2
MSFLENLTSKIRDGIEEAFGDDKNDESRPQEQYGQQQSYNDNSFSNTTPANRFHSFAPQRMGNDAKWYVDGCGYMWAVSVALEEAQESIWILDWWLSPGMSRFVKREFHHNVEADIS